MKRFLVLAATTLAVAAPAAAMADHERDYRYDRRYERDYGHDDDRDDRYERSRRYERQNGRQYGQYQRGGWHQGEYLPHELRRRSIRDFWRYGLIAPADQNNRWYVVGNDAVMANIHNGLIATVTYDIF